MISLCNGLYIIPENSTYPEGRIYLQSPRSKFLGPHDLVYPLIGELIYVDQLNSSANHTGKIVLHQLKSLEFQEDAAKTLANTNLVAFISVNYNFNLYPGMAQYVRARANLPNISFPLYELTSLQNETLTAWFSNQTDGLRIAFDGDDPNPWDHVYLDEIPILSNVILVTSGLNLIYAAYKLGLLLMRDGPRLNLSQIVLSVNFVGMLIRFIWACPDPFAIFGIYQYAWSEVGLTLPIPFVVSGSLMITLYWHEMIQRTARAKINPFLERMLIPFIILSVFVLLWELATCIARGLGATAVILLAIDGVVYAIIILSLFIFFIVTKIRLVRVFRSLNKSLNHRERRLKIASNVVIAIGVFLLILLYGLVIAGVSSVFWIPGVFFSEIVIVLSSINTLAFLQIMLIRVPLHPWLYIIRSSSYLGDVSSAGSPPASPHHSRAAVSLQTGSDAEDVGLEAISSAS